MHSSAPFILGTMKKDNACIMHPCSLLYMKNMLSSAEVDSHDDSTYCSDWLRCFVGGKTRSSFWVEKKIDIVQSNCDV